MNRFDSFKQFYLGNASISTYKRYLCFVLLYYFILITIAQISYPGGYSLFENTISDMGGLRNNPEVWWVYSIGGSFVGILLIPIFIFHRNNAAKIEKTLANLYILFSIIGSLSFSLVCAIPQDFGTPHDVFADLAFGGLGLGVLLSLVIQLKCYQKNDGNYRKNWLFLIYSPLFIIGILQAIFQNIKFDEQIVDPKWTDWPIWQWTLMLSVLWAIFSYTLSEKKINGELAFIF